MVRILIVEDNPLFRDALQESMAAHFPTAVIEGAENGGEALRKINGASPQIVFLDIRLPGENGLQLAQKIKKGFPDIRIAMMTSYDLPEYRRAASQYGADRFFVKDSLDWKEIEEFIRAIPEDKWEGKKLS